MSILEKATVSGFKTQFPKGIPYLPVYDNTQIYILGDVVYSNGFYKSLKNNNTYALSDTTAWKSIVDSVNNYISDDDITRAFLEASVNFNESLFEGDTPTETENIQLMLFYYLTAHYVCIDANNTNNGINFGYMGIAQSRSVGSVSESYAIPKWIYDDPLLGQYALTGYGLKYLSLLMPYLVGNIIFVEGKINL